MDQGTATSRGSHLGVRVPLGLRLWLAGSTSQDLGFLSPQLLLVNTHPLLFTIPYRIGRCPCSQGAGECLPYMGHSLVTQLWPILKETWPEAVDTSHLLKEEIPATASSTCLQGAQKLR